MKPNVEVEARGLHYNMLFLTMEKHAHFKGIIYKLPNKMEKQKYLHRHPHLATELVAGESPQNVLTRLYNKECFNKHQVKVLRVNVSKNQRYCENRGHSPKFDFAHTFYIDRPWYQNKQNEVSLL